MPSLPPLSVVHQSVRRHVAGLSGVQPGLVVLSDADHTSSQISAHVDLGELAWRPDQQGQVSRVQDVTVVAEVALLPEWALLDDYTLTGRVEVLGVGAFKVKGLHVLAGMATIKALRWPETAD